MFLLYESKTSIIRPNWTNWSYHIRDRYSWEPKKQIIAQGEVAPPGTVVSRYQVRQQQNIYWYYKLQAQEPIFPKTKEAKSFSKYKHLGKPGSQAHITAVMQVVRRSQIDEIQRTIDTLSQNLLDVGFDEQPKQKSNN